MEKAKTTSTSYTFPKNPILFRFSFLLILQYILAFNNGAFIPLQYVSNLFRKLCYLILDLNPDNLGQEMVWGVWKVDLQVLGLISISAVLGTAIWALFDRKRQAFPKAQYLLTTFTRYYIGLMLFTYGLVKVIKTQFPTPSMVELTKPLGDFTPMGLAWSFFGYSTGYNLFLGIAECLAILLLFRKTATLGAMISFAVSLNIFILNICYDIPVKIISGGLMFLSLYLLLPNIIRLWKIFFKGEASQLVPMPSPPIYKKYLIILLIVAKYILIIGSIGRHYQINEQTIIWLNQFQDKKFELYGAYFVGKDQLDEAKQLGIPSRWKYIYFFNKDLMKIKYDDGTMVEYSAIIDTSKKHLKIITKSGEKGLDLYYKKEANGDMIWTEKSSESENTIRLTRFQEMESKLLSH